MILPISTRPTMNDRQTCRFCFTLIELILALGILALLAAVQLPRLNGMMSKKTLASEAKLACKAIASARERAVYKRRAVRICTNDSGSNLWFEEQTNPAEAPDSYSKIKSGPLGRKLELSLTSEIDTKEKYLTLWADGSAEAGNITLVGTEGKSVYIELAASGATSFKIAASEEIREE